MEYQIQTQNEQDDVIATAIAGREQEYFAYDLNEKNFETLLLQSGVPVILPSELERYKNMTRDQLIVNLNETDAELVASWQWQQELEKRRRAEKMEKLKVQKVRDALISSITPERLEAAKLRRLA